MPPRGNIIVVVSPFLCSFPKGCPRQWSVGNCNDDDFSQAPAWPCCCKLQANKYQVANTLPFILSHSARLRRGRKMSANTREKRKEGRKKNSLAPPRPFLAHCRPRAASGRVTSSSLLLAVLEGRVFKSKQASKREDRSLCVRASVRASAHKRQRVGAERTAAAAVAKDPPTAAVDSQQQRGARAV